MTDLVLGGKLYRVADMDRRTLIHDVHLRQLMQRTGLDRTLPERGEAAEEYSGRLVAGLLSSGALCDLLGLYLLPASKSEEDWTPELGAAVAAEVARVNTDDDRRLAQQLGAEAVLGFFLRELRSIVIFPSSSDAVKPANGSDGIAAH